MFSDGGDGSRGFRFGCTNFKVWIRSHDPNRFDADELCSMSHEELQLMLGVIGTSLIMLPIYHAKQLPCSVLCEQLKADPIIRGRRRTSRCRAARCTRVCSRTAPTHGDDQLGVGAHQAVPQMRPPHREEQVLLMQFGSSTGFSMFGLMEADVFILLNGGRFGRMETAEFAATFGVY